MIKYYQTLTAFKQCLLQYQMRYRQRKEVIVIEQLIGKQLIFYTDYPH